MRQANPTTKLSAVLLACTAMLSACGGGGGGGDGGNVQDITFNFPGGKTLALLPADNGPAALTSTDRATVALIATASSRLPVTFSSDTPALCTVSGSTLTLVASGECMVTATQAGGEGYQSISMRQLFVIPKYPQTIGFSNPGWQPLDATPFELVAASSLSKPITFTSQTPTVCTASATTVSTLVPGLSVSSTSVTKLTDGQCTIAATEPGAIDYAAVSVNKTIPIGTARAPLLTFASGYNLDGNTTLERGTVSQTANGNLLCWGWCNGDWTTHSVSATGSTYTSSHVLKTDNPTAQDGWFWGTQSLHVMAPGLDKESTTVTTLGGVQIEAQAALKLNLAENTEWFGTSDNKVNVDLHLGLFNKKANGDACNVKLRGVITPTKAAATDYAVNLKTMTVQDACELPFTNTDVWLLLQVSTVVEVEISPSTLNSSVKRTDSSGTSFPTEITAGSISFE